MKRATFVGAVLEGTTRDVDSSTVCVIEFSLDGRVDMYLCETGTVFTKTQDGRRLNEEAMFFHHTLIAQGCAAMIEYAEAKGL